MSAAIVIIFIYISEKFALITQQPCFSFMIQI